MSRIYGLGSVFGKTLRDSGPVVLGIGLLIGLVNLVTILTIADQFKSAADRAAIAAQMGALPQIFQGLLGEPINILTLPGFISWRVVGFLPEILGIWSIVALSGTIAGEAARGTLELVASTPISRRSLATQKLGAHVAGVFIAMAIVSVLTWLGCSLFASLPGDEISIFTAFSEFGLVGLLSLVAGGIAFALGPLLGRGVAAGVAGVYLFGAYLINGYADIVPGFDILRLGSMFFWTAHHRPLAGVSDFPAVLLAAGVVVVLGAIGVVLFIRRDLGSMVSVGSGLARVIQAGPYGAIWRALGVLSVGRWSLAGPGLRSFGERLPAAVAWGAALGVYGFIIAVAADQFSASLAAVPQITEIVRQLYPDIDFTTAGGILQLTLFGFVALVCGVAAAALVQGWASDERDGRLEVVLSTPIRRVAWFLRSGFGLLLAILMIGVVIGLATAIGAAISGDPALPVFAGAVVLGVYAAALGGVGILVAGLGRPGWAGAAVGGLTIAFYLVDLLGSILHLPDFITNLVLTRHLGQPMAGSFNVPGLALCAALALGGLVIGAWGFSRRDLRAN